MTKHCSICGLNAEQVAFFDSAQYSMTGHFYELNNVEIPTMPISVTRCSSCDFLSLDASKLRQKNYENVDRNTAGQLPSYSQELVGLISSNTRSRHDKLIEIGSNDGTFIKLLLDSGFTKISAVEPSHTLAASCKNVTEHTYNDFFDNNFVDRNIADIGKLRGIICRHTLEHVADPKDLVLAASRLLEPHGFLLIEVPDTSFMLENNFAHEIWDEHLNYFTMNSLTNLAQFCGFKIELAESWGFRGTKNIIALFKKLTIQDNAGFQPERPETRGAIDSFSMEWKGLSEQLILRLKKCSKPVYAIGASHPQINFLNFSGVHPFIDFLIDDDPYKTGKHAQFENGIQIISTDIFLEDLNRTKNGTVLLTAFNQQGWQKSLTSRILCPDITLIDPYALN